LSSAKAGNGVEQLRDENTNTFWQSDGAQPHFVNIQFMKKTRVQVNTKINIGNRNLSRFKS
jgi:anaphase-promoting complex subunit 10